MFSLLSVLFCHFPILSFFHGLKMFYSSILYLMLGQLPSPSKLLLMLKISHLFPLDSFHEFIREPAGTLRLSSNCIVVAILTILVMKESNQFSFHVKREIIAEYFHVLGW